MLPLESSSRGSMDLCLEARDLHRRMTAVPVGTRESGIDSRHHLQEDRPRRLGPEYSELLLEQPEHLPRRPWRVKGGRALDRHRLRYHCKAVVALGSLLGDSSNPFSPQLHLALCRLEPTIGWHLWMKENRALRTWKKISF